MTISWKRLFTDSLLTTPLNMARIPLQIASLLLLTRSLGTSGYGVLAGILAIYLTAAQLVGLGTTTTLVRHYSRYGVGRQEFVSVLKISILSGILISVLVLATVSVVGENSPLSIEYLTLFAISEIVIFPSLFVVAAHLQGSSQIRLASLVLLSPPIARLAAVLALVIFPLDKTVETLAEFHILSAIVFTGGCWLLVRSYVWKSFVIGGKKIGVCEGLPFAVSNISSTAMSELDKTFMLQYNGKEIAGIYSAAVRIVQALAIPILSLGAAAAPSLFKAGKGLQGSVIFR